MDAKPVDAQAEGHAAADPHWISYDSVSADGGAHLLTGPLTNAGIVIDDLAHSGVDQAWDGSSELGGGQEFTRTFNIPVKNFFFLLYASAAVGTVVSVHFSGSMETNDDDMDAADAYFTLVDLERGISWTVTGEDLGWFGQGSFGPSKTDATHLFDGSLELETDHFYFWESINQSPGVGCIGCTASYNGKFVITVEHPSPVALTASFALEAPDPGGYAPRDTEYSFVPNPTSTVDYAYDESWGYWAEQPVFSCFDGDINPTNFYLGLYNLTGKPVQACTFQASWDAQQHECSQAILDVLNHPFGGGSFLIRTEDFVYVPDPDCQTFSPTTVHVLPGVQHWMWIEFVIDDIAYERRMVFVKE